MQLYKTQGFKVQGEKLTELKGDLSGSQLQGACTSPLL